MPLNPALSLRDRCPVPASPAHHLGETRNRNPQRARHESGRNVEQWAGEDEHSAEVRWHKHRQQLKARDRPGGMRAQPSLVHDALPRRDLDRHTLAAENLSHTYTPIRPVGAALEGGSTAPPSPGLVCPALMCPGLVCLAASLRRSAAVPLTAARSTRCRLAFLSSPTVTIHRPPCIPSHSRLPSVIRASPGLTATRAVASCRAFRCLSSSFQAQPNRARQRLACLAGRAGRQVLQPGNSGVVETRSAQREQRGLAVTACHGVLALLKRPREGTLLPSKTSIKDYGLHTGMPIGVDIENPTACGTASCALRAAPLDGHTWNRRLPYDASLSSDAWGSCDRKLARDLPMALTSPANFASCCSRPAALVAPSPCATRCSSCLRARIERTCLANALTLDFKAAIS